MKDQEVKACCCHFGHDLEMFALCFHQGFYHPPGGCLAFYDVQNLPMCRWLSCSSHPGPKALAQIPVCPVSCNTMITSVLGSDYPNRSPILMDTTQFPKTERKSDCRKWNFFLERELVVNNYEMYSLPPQQGPQNSSLLLHFCSILYKHPPYGGKSEQVRLAEIYAKCR